MPTDVPKVTEKTSGPTVKQFSIFLQNKVGALLEVVKLLNANEVHVLALNSQDSTDSAIVRIIASDPDAVESIFDLHEIAYSISEILVVEMKEVATDLKRMLQSLLMALHLDDQECGWSVLAGEGFRILSQTDLSR
jgi:hypothetical protein